MSQIVKTPNPPYYAAIFTFKRTDVEECYKQMEEMTTKMVSKLQGYLGFETATDKDGFGILISYWDSIESINAWRHNSVHRGAKENGREKWYSEYVTRICKVETDYFSDNSLG